MTAMSHHMTYLVDVGEEKQVRVELLESERGNWSADVDGQAIDLQFRGRDEDGDYILVVNGAVRKFRLARDGSGVVLSEGGHDSRVHVQAAGDVLIEHSSPTDTDDGGPDTLHTPITGIVLEVLFAQGDTVEKGEPLVIVEAMKMENTLLAPRSGVVKEVLIERSQTVYVGDALVRIG